MALSWKVLQSHWFPTEVQTALGFWAESTRPYHTLTWTIKRWFIPRFLVIFCGWCSKRAVVNYQTWSYSPTSTWTSSWPIHGHWSLPPGPRTYPPPKGSPYEGLIKNPFVSLNFRPDNHTIESRFAKWLSKPTNSKAPGKVPSVIKIQFTY